jgi:DNA-binding transcriptional MerR regulator
MAKYSTKHLGTLFGVTPETIRLWTAEFAEYLSPTAHPGPNRARYYTQEDLDVLTLVANLKADGIVFTEIHASLRAGQRGDAAVQSPDEISEIATANREQRLALEVERLHRQLAEVRHELESQRKVADQVHAMREDNVHLKARAELIEEERHRLVQQITELNARIEQLAEKAGHEYAKGFLDALREANVTPTRE